jgi:predicted transcriptional regulator
MDNMEDNLFFRHFRKRGFGLTLEILAELNSEAEESVFFQALKEKGSYLNEYYRVKKELLKQGLIKYRLNEEYEKVIILTEKGNAILNKIKEIEEILSQPIDE